MNWYRKGKCTYI